MNPENRKFELIKEGNDHQPIDATGQTPKIFKLDIECFEILYSVSKTCKRMRRSEYRQQLVNECSSLEQLCSMTSTISKALQPIVSDDFLEYFLNLNIDGMDMQQFEFSRVYWDALKSLKSIHFNFCYIVAEKLKIMERILANVELVCLSFSWTGVSLHESVLKYCMNAKHLLIFGPVNDHAWLLQRYPKLEHLARFGDEFVELDALKTFFQQNPNVRSFSMDASQLLINRDLMMQIELDELFVEFDNEMKMELYELRNMCYGQGVYKRLHVAIDMDESYVQQLTLLDKLVGLYYYYHRSRI